ncbi:MAG: sodium:calcium symporter, partial [Candidatus Omnitrophica bacterium]|nr:sodium:calcium symporter [Candidatus Omnitrophota bacterium]
VTPVFLLAILISWFYQEWGPTVLMKNVPAENRPFVLGTRAFLIALFVALSILVKIAWKKKRRLARP